MYHLVSGVNPRVGAAGTVHPYRRVRHLGQRPFQFSLYRNHPIARLHLPTVEGAAIVFKGERDTLPCGQRVIGKLQWFRQPGGGGRLADGLQ